MSSFTEDHINDHLPKIGVALVGLEKRHLSSTIAIYLKLLNQSVNARGFHIQVICVVSSVEDDRKRAINLFKSQQKLLPIEYETIEQALKNTNVNVIDLNLLTNFSIALEKSIEANKFVVMNHRPHDITKYTNVPLSVVEPWSYKPSVIKISKMLDGYCIGCCLSYTIEVEMEMEENFINGEENSIVHIVRVIRILFGEVTSLQYQNSSDDIHITHQERAIEGTLKFIFGGNDGHNNKRSKKTNVMRVFGNNNKILEWNIDSSEIKIIHNKKVTQLLVVRGDSFSRGGYKDALLDCFYYFQNILMTTNASNDDNNNLGGSNHHQHDEAGLPEHRCSLTEGLRDAKVVRAIQLTRETNELVFTDKHELPLLEKGYQIYDVNRSRKHTPCWIARCRSTKQVQFAIQWANEHQLNTKACGSGHSWSSVGDINNGLCIDTRDMQRVISIENSTRVVSCQPGISIRNLVDALSNVSLCIPSLPVLLRQTLGGAIATGSHGSSLVWGSLSDQVVGVTLVDLKGEIIVLRDDINDDDNKKKLNLLRASKMSCGRLGVITEVKLKVIPLYSIIKKETMIDMTNILNGSTLMIEHAKRNEHCWIHWKIGSHTCLCLSLQRYTKENDATNAKSVVYNGRNWFPLGEIGQTVLGDGDSSTSINNNDTKSIENVDPTVSNKNQKCLCLSMQYAFSLDALPNVLSSIANEALHNDHRGKLIEIKFLNSSNSLSSPLLAYNIDGPVACINLWWKFVNINGAFESLQSIEKVMQNAGVLGRPHFGKLHQCSSSYMKSVCPQLTLFEKIELEHKKIKRESKDEETKKERKEESAVTPTPPLTPPHYLCFVTNGEYAPGAVCLAQSLQLCNSSARLRVIATSNEAKEALEMEASLSPIAPPMDVVLELNELPVYDSDKTHNGRGATLAVDAPRRCLYDDKRDGWVLLDADLIAIQNPDQLFHLLNNNEITMKRDMYATGNFRIKKKRFGTLKEGGNFNAGVMVVPRPLTSDGKALQLLVNEAGEDDTEELLMNDLFKGRCGDLARGYNVPKRVMQHAPLLWKEMINNKELIFLHYMGAKPWMKNITQRQNADWESERPSYKELEKLWWKVRRGEATLKNGTLHHLLPLKKDT